MTRPVAKPLSRRERRAKARYDRPAAPHRASKRRAAQRPAWQSPVVLTSIGALLIGGAIIAFAGGFLGGSTGGQDLITPTTSYAGVTVDGASMGSSTAPVVIDVVSDFQCPACKLFITSELPSLITDFVRPGLVRIQSTDVDIIDRGGSTESLELAAGAFCAAQQNRYWAYHDLVFWNQGRENRDDHNAAFIARIATAAGVDKTAFDACDTRTDIRQPVRDRTASLAAQGISSTPTLRINGKSITGVPAYNDLHLYLTQLLATISPAPISPTAAPAASPGPTVAPVAS